MTKICRKNNNRDTWIIKENTHDPIIDKQIYDEVQEIKFGKQVLAKVKYEYLLQDLLYCGYCGRKLQYKIYKSADKQSFLYESSGFNCSLFYKKRCSNNAYFREKVLNEIIVDEIKKRLRLIDLDKVINKFVEYCKANDKNLQNLQKYRNDIERLERKKSVLYKKKCEGYIMLEEFKIEYARIKEEIEILQSLIAVVGSYDDNFFKEQWIKKFFMWFKNGDFISNVFLKEIVNRIEVYSKNRIEIIFNL